MSSIRHRTNVKSNATNKYRTPSKPNENDTSADVNRKTFVNSIPSAYFIAFFLVLLPIRLLSALFSPISDCDEVYNYWEEIHYLLYNHGLQTWEYSPQYALRSYFYLWLYIIPIKIFQFVGINDKIMLFYLLRCLLGFISSLVEARLALAVARRFSLHFSLILVFFLAMSPGMFHASVALLPQNFTMFATALVLAYWLERKFNKLIIAQGIATLIGWPFSGATALPIAIDMINHYRLSAALIGPIITAILTAATTLGLSILVDYHYYKKLVLAVLNIALYNSNQATDAVGANLYGVEPASYFVKNLLLNFNLQIVLTTILPLLAPLHYIFPRNNSCSNASKLEGLYVLKYLSPAIIWLAAMFSMPHKEERFLFIIYPAICLAAAYSLFSLHTFLRRILSSQFSDVLLGSVMLLIATFSISRSYSLILNYSAPFSVYSALESHLSLPNSAASSASRPLYLPTDISLQKEQLIYAALGLSDPNNHYSSAEYAEIIAAANATLSRKENNDNNGRLANVCVGKEWYRYPSSFFLPNNSRLQFIRSGFGGLLPKQYFSTAETQQNRAIGTSVLPSGMNERNEAVESRLIPMILCDFVLDFELQDHGKDRIVSIERKIGRNEGQKECSVKADWVVVKESSFLDADASHNAFARAFYIPFYSSRFNRYSAYRLYKRNMSSNC
jgi:alpha-1,2-mannosyltransferase